MRSVSGKRLARGLNGTAGGYSASTEVITSLERTEPSSASPFQFTATSRSRKGC
jgi:hypothetical protein